MNRHALWPTVSLLSLAIAQHAAAQTSASSSSSDAARADQGPTMVVTASRTNTTKEDSPQTVRIITEEEIAQQLDVTTDSSQILSNLLPSYSPNRQKMTGSGETLRGRTPLFLIDGIPQSNPLRPTGRESHTIDFSQVEQIEVIQGANATNGVGAAGGVINIITKRPEPGSFNQHFSAQLTTPTSELDGDTLSYKTDYGFSGNEGAVDYVFGLSYEDQGLYLDGKGDPVGVDNTQGDLMDSRSYDLLGKLAYWIDDNQRVQFTLNHYDIEGHNDYVSVTGDRDAGIPTTSERGTPEGDAPYNEVWTTGLSYDNYDLAGMQLSAQAYYQDYEALFGATDSGTFQDPSLAPVGTYYDQSSAKTEKFGTKVSLTKDDLWDDRLKLTGGFDTLFDETEQYLYGSGRTYVPPTDYTDLSPFFQAEFAPVDSLLLSAGVRYEYAELDIDDYQTVWANNGVDVEGGNPDFDETLYNVGAVWKPVQGVSLFTNYSEGFSIPDVGRALRGIDTPGQSVDSIDNLRPIVTENIETGVRYENDRLAAELSYYESTSDFGSRLTEQDGVFIMNRQETQITGIEASVDYAFTERHSGRLAYSHMTGLYDSDNDGDLDAELSGLDVSPDRLVGSWSANWTDKLSTFLQANYAFDESYDEEEREFDGYLLVDAAVGYRLPTGKINVGVSNLLDEDYITYYSQSALVNDDRYFAGRGRTLTLGYSVEF
ncbi:MULTISPECIES: TonB-dependent receptor [Halomonas]|uniref:TonB-dependent receptor n=1 Tax=Halomonas TaxID=2745 RepID=UPI001A903151|nr:MULTISPECIES: TonB-dependent receptor [Halomonas]MBN8411460.1 TonB-dependent receptor [Halomonas litopenaei]MBY5928176.1 TonB-dependent receptor [Halomonas sp. DP8Y7-3]MBY5967283.1 TonB-dependent receptor [Halomonas denitrificans]MBY6208611.1 TonB-dependent receptor [Halomonas sp. DP3Y7-2]MBY6227082.1 TonB-dependent receptor [Halomonas sp. DP3Y7-1]